MKWNNMKTNNILVGQKIKLTPSGTVASKSSPAPAKSQAGKSGNGKYTWYTIQSGDNLWEIADKFDVTVSQLKSLNGLKNNSRLTPGQKIKVPK